MGKLTRREKSTATFVRRTSFRCVDGEARPPNRVCSWLPDFRPPFVKEEGGRIAASVSAGTRRSSLRTADLLSGRAALHKVPYLPHPRARRGPRTQRTTRHGFMLVVALFSSRWFLARFTDRFRASLAVSYFYELGHALCWPEREIRCADSSIWFEISPLCT